MDVRPGERLAFTRALIKAKQWPPTKIRRRRTDVPPAMPYIVVPADAADDGARPIDRERAVHSTAIEVLDAAGAPVEHPQPGVAYSVRATLRNLGPAAAYGGVAEFFVAGETLGVEGFLAQPGSAVTVRCRRAWTPADAAAAAATVVVCAYDALLDRPERRFAPAEDRHVGQRDLLADFSGTWDGQAHFANSPGGGGTMYRVVVAQTGLAVDVSIFQQVTHVDGPLVPLDPTGIPPRPRVPTPRGGTPRGGTTLPSGAGTGFTQALPAAPQIKGGSTVVGNRVQLSLVGLNFQPPVPFTNDEVTLTLTGPSTLHVAHRTTFVDPADPRGPIDLVADLAR